MLSWSRTGCRLLPTADLQLDAQLWALFATCAAQIAHCTGQEIAIDEHLRLAVHLLVITTGPALSASLMCVLCERTEHSGAQDALDVPMQQHSRLSSP